MSTQDAWQELDLPAVSADPPPWAARRVDKFHSLSDIRREQSSVYWLWRKHGLLTASQAATVIQALRVIGTTMEVERDTRIVELERKLRELEAELELQRLGLPTGALAQAASSH